MIWREPFRYIFSNMSRGGGHSRPTVILFPIAQVLTALCGGLLIPIVCQYGITVSLGEWQDLARMDVAVGARASRSLGDCRFSVAWGSSTAHSSTIYYSKQPNRPDTTRQTHQLPLPHNFLPPLPPGIRYRFKTGIIEPRSFSSISRVSPYRQWLPYPPQKSAPPVPIPLPKSPRCPHQLTCDIIHGRIGRR